MKKLISLALALVMILSLSVTAFAAGTGSITITPPTGVDDSATNTYKIYKVFDAVGDGTGEGGKISYKLVEGKTTAPTGFTVDEAGNVTRTADLNDTVIKAIAEYVKNDAPIATVTAKGTANAVASNLPNGYYYITTTTGTVVTIDSTNPNATVNDKNTVPKLDKKITGASSYDADGKKALAQIGTDVKFTATITVGTGAKGYIFHDKMESSLNYKGDVKVTVNGNPVAASAYTVGKVGDDTFTITFADSYLATLTKGTEIVITYSATITSDALQTDPANNTAYLSYGDENSHNKTPESSTSVYNAKFTVTKHNGEGKALEGAGFVIKNAEGKYYKLENNVVTWVDSIDAATEYKSDANGAVPAFTGLANGTYTLEEKTVPAGYNKAEDSTFTIAEYDYTAANLIKSATVVNNAGTELPSTGGMGTTLFYVLGGLMVLGAVVVLVTKKRMGAAE